VTDDAPEIRVLLEHEKWLEYYMHLGVEMQRGSERIRAILGGVLVDEYLREVIAARLKDDVIATALLDSRPLGGYRDRCNFAAKVGLIGPKNLKTLNLIGEIRNYFAHRGFIADEAGNIADLSFSDEYVVERCPKLWWPLPADGGPTPNVFASTDYEKRFRTAVANMAGRLWVLRFKGQNQLLD
jgi:hypothetical protein